MNILIVSATDFEIQDIIEYLGKHFIKKDDIFTYKNINIKILITGVGSPNTIYALTKELIKSKVDLVINLGIAGSFTNSLNLGDVVLVESDFFADLGIEEKDGSFTDLFELEFESNNGIYHHNVLLNPTIESFSFLKKVKALTVNKVHGNETSIQSICNKYKTDIETMEGAGVHLVCLNEGVNFMQIRAISNYVEPRNRANWKIKEAIDNLNHVSTELLTMFI